LGFAENFVAGHFQEWRFLQVAHNYKAKSAEEDHRAERRDDWWNVEARDENSVQQTGRDSDGESGGKSSPIKIRPGGKGRHDASDEGNN
jgi:hypothetical protein